MRLVFDKVSLCASNESLGTSPLGRSYPAGYLFSLSYSFILRDLSQFLSRWYLFIDNLKYLSINRFVSLVGSRFVAIFQECDV